MEAEENGANNIFNGIIKQIYIEESGAITFVLKGDLEFSAEV